MDFYNGHFLAKFYQIIEEILHESSKNPEFKEFHRKPIQIKILHRTYLTNKHLLNLSHFFQKISENGINLEIDLKLEINNILLFDKFMQLFIQENLDNQRTIMLDRHEIIKFTQLVFKYDFVTQIKKYLIDSLINYISFFSIDEIIDLANTYDIIELKEFVKENKSNLSLMITKALSSSEDRCIKEKLTSFKL